jgi:putative spermidine/putrescine transport system permease protein
MTRRFVRKVVAWSFVALVLAYLLLPGIVVFPLALSTSYFLEFPPPGYSFRWYSEFLADDQWVGAAVKSIWVASAAAVVATVIGLAGAYYTARRQGWAARAYEPLTVLPLVVPIIVFALGVYAIALRMEIVGNPVLLILVQSIVAAPYAYVNIRVGLSTINPNLELAARSLGASPSRAFLRILLPLLAPALFLALTIAFIMCLDETVLALFLGSSSAPTLPVKMFTSITYDLNPLVPVAASFMLAVTIVSAVILLVLQKLAKTLLRVRRS